MITRRQMLLALAGALLEPAFAAEPARAKRVIAVVFERTPDAISERYLAAFKTGMRELGLQEGLHYSLVLRSAQEDLSKLPALIKELVATRVDLLIATGTPSASAGQKWAPNTPVLIITVSDPVAAGLAQSLSRPGFNVTGLTAGGADLYPKRLDLLRQIVPGLERIGVLYTAENAADLQTVKTLAAACERYKWQLFTAPIRGAETVAGAFELLIRSRVQGAVVAGSSNTQAWRRAIAEHAAVNKIPAVYAQPIFTEAGGLISYSPKYEDLFRRAAAYADKIFKGARPGELPIEQPNTFYLTVNLKAARTIGIKLPDDLLLRADRVIE